VLTLDDSLQEVPACMHIPAAVSSAYGADSEMGRGRCPMPREVITPVSIALCVVALAMLIAAAAFGAVRRRDFRHFENRSKAWLAFRFPIPTIDPSSPAELRRRELSPLVALAHRKANAAQNRYHRCVSAAAGCLIVASLALVLDLLLETGWPDHDAFGLSRHAVEAVLTWIDAIAIAGVLVMFLCGRRVNRRWIADRAAAELLRQYHCLDLIFPSASSPTPASDPEARFNFESAAVAAGVSEGPTPDIVTRIEQFWSERRDRIAHHPLTEQDLSTDAVLIYLERRVRSQIGWFADSKARLEGIAERRNYVLIMLYSATAFLAASKLLLFLITGRQPVYLVLAVIVATGISAAFTAYYINQNSRSLIHRYNTQLRRLAVWLEEFDHRWRIAELSSSRSFDLREKDELRAGILGFEALMIEELIDWSHITSNDTIELAP
jgi:hypothetical protein